MNSIEITGRTVEEAIEEALQELNASREHVEITVLDEGNKGLLFGIGSKLAKVAVKKRPAYELKMEKTIAFLNELFDKMDIKTDIIGSYDEEAIHIEIAGDDLGVLIGRRGHTLDSLQYITGLAVNRQDGNEDWARIILDVEGYRERREETLRTLAQRLASKAQATGRRVALDPMNAMERRIVHQELQQLSGVETHSEGKDPYRKVIIVPDR